MYLGGTIQNGLVIRRADDLHFQGQTQLIIWYKAVDFPISGAWFTMSTPEYQAENPYRGSQCTQEAPCKMA